MSKEKIQWKGHAILGRRAFEMLPEWEKKLIKPDMSPAGMNKPYIPEGLNSPGDKMGFMCTIMDLVYYDECRPYATLPDGRWIPHSPASSFFSAINASTIPMSNSATLILIETLMNKMVDAIKDSDWEAAIRSGGALGHYLQEPFTPAHAMDNTLFHELFPDPDPQRHIRLHPEFDCATGNFANRIPTLMGVSVKEASFRLLLEIHKGIKDGKKLVMPVIMSVYQGLPRKVREAMLSEQAGNAAYLTACAWHTAICIALKRFHDKDIRRLSVIKLTDMQPYFWHAWKYAEMTPGNLVSAEKKVPIHAWTAGEKGTVKEKCFKDGFGMGGHMGIKFFVDASTYKYFSCQAGLPSRVTEGQTTNTNVTFSIEVDELENTVYSEDIEYKARKVFETKLLPGEPVKNINVDISGAFTLIIKAKSVPFIGNDGNPVFSIPHIAICNPRISKEKQPDRKPA